VSARTRKRARGASTTIRNLTDREPDRANVQEAAFDLFDHIPWDAVRTTALALYA
jgi:hypothetical protein